MQRGTWGYQMQKTLTNFMTVNFEDDRNSQEVEEIRYFLYRWVRDAWNEFAFCSHDLILQLHFV